MSAREAMFARIRGALGVTGEEINRNAAVDDRLRRAPKGVIPKRGQLPAAERVARQFGRVFNAQMLWLESIRDLSAELADLASVRVEA